MGLHLTSADMRLCEAASQTMLSPLAATSVDDWRRDVSRSVRELFHSDKTIIMLPKGERLFFSDEAPALAQGVEEYVTSYSVEDFHLSDVIVDLWNELRRKERLEVFTWDVNEQMIGRYGYSMRDSEMVSGVLKSHRVDDFTGCYVETPIGEVLLWMLFEQKATHRFGESSTSLLRALLPSFKAGLDTLVRFDAQRLALDLIKDAMVVFGPGRKEIHRNSALCALYDADPDAEQIRSEVASLAIALDLLNFPRSRRASDVPFPQSVRSVTTKTARYDLTGTLLPSGAFGSDVSTLVSVTRHGAVELPGPQELRERYGVTAREAEVALLVARGHPNDDIADRLYLSPHTVRRHTANLFDKLDVKSRKALALKFLEG